MSNENNIPVYPFKGIDFTAEEINALLRSIPNKLDRDLVRDGKSAYEVAVQNGYTGTVTEWLQSLRGQKGDALTYSDLTDEQKQELKQPAIEAGNEVREQSSSVLKSNTQKTEQFITKAQNTLDSLETEIRKQSSSILASNTEKTNDLIEKSEETVSDLQKTIIDKADGILNANTQKTNQFITKAQNTLDSLETEIREQSNSVLESNSEKTNEFIKASETALDNAEKASEQAIENSKTHWLPTLDSQGNLSWSRSFSTVAPATKNIKGPQGNSGVSGSTDNIEVVNDLNGGESSPERIKVLSAEQGKVLNNKYSEVDKKINEFNISRLYPTNGTGGTNKYTLETAIAQVPAEYRVQGLKVTFINENNDTESWEYKGNSWVVANFTEVGAKKFSELDKDNILLSCVSSSSYLRVKNGENLSVWEDNKLLDNNGGTVESNGYSTTDYIEYKGQYGAYSALTYNASSVGVSYPLLAYYDLETKKHIKSFYLVGGLRTILIPPGYCVKVCTNTSLKETLIFKANAELEAVPFSVDEIPKESIEASKIKNKTISTAKIDEGLFTKLQYSISAICNEDIEGSEFDINWTDNNILDSNGNLVVSAGYSVSDFIDYSGNYGQYQALMFTPCLEALSYGTVAYFDKDSHSFKALFPIYGAEKRTILIPPNYSVRIVTNTSRKSKIVLGNTAKKKEIVLPDNIVTNGKIADGSVTNKKVADKSLEFTKIKDAVFEEEDKTDTITASEENTELKKGLYYGGQFHEELEGTFWTIVFNQTIDKYYSLDLSVYSIGTTGGAILDADGGVIEEISTEGGGDSNYVVPDNAYKLALTIRKDSPYGKSIVGKYKAISSKYSLPNLVLIKEQIPTEEITYKGNQWYGKKICILGTSVAYGSNAEKAYAKIASERLGFEIVPAGVPGLAIHAKIDNEHGGIIAPLTYGSTCLSKAEYDEARQAGATSIVIHETPKPTDGENWTPGNDSNYNSYYRTWENVFSSVNADVDLWIYSVVPNNTNFDDTDWENFNKDIWSYNDGQGFDSHRTTFLGALLFLMDKMYALNPNARMVLVLDSAFEYVNGKADFKKVSEQWNIPIIDLWGKINTSPKSLQVLKSKDGTDNHPSTFGQERLGDMFTNELLLIS